MKLQYKIIFIIIICVASFFAGRLTIKQQEIVKFVKGEETIRQNYNKLMSRIERFKIQGSGDER